MARRAPLVGSAAGGVRVRCRNCSRRRRRHGADPRLSLQMLAGPSRARRVEKDGDPQPETARRSLLGGDRGLPRFPPPAGIVAAHGVAPGLGPSASARVIVQRDRQDGGRCRQLSTAPIAWRGDRAQVAHRRRRLVPYRRLHGSSRPPDSSSGARLPPRALDPDPAARRHTTSCTGCGRADVAARRSTRALGGRRRPPTPTHSPRPPGPRPPRRPRVLCTRRRAAVRWTSACDGPDRARRGAPAGRIADARHGDVLMERR
jgi:hypothetical protein